MDQTNPDTTLESLPPSATASPTTTPEQDERNDEIARLRARVGELQRERDHLVAIVDILQEISSSLHFVDILQAIARKLGDAFGLDRCAIFLSGEQNEVRLVASYEDPTIRNLVVDLNRYPERACSRPSTACRCATTWWATFARRCSSCWRVRRSFS
jgi:hypothetical protein